MRISHKGFWWAALAMAGSIAAASCGAQTVSAPTAAHHPAIKKSQSSPSATTTKPASFLAQFPNVTTIASTVPANGDENPYAVMIAPVSAGSIQKGDVLLDNFNARSNLQATGRTIMDVHNGKIRLLATVPASLPGCGTGVGLTTAMTMLNSGYIIVGDLPAPSGAINTAHPGCLVVLSPQGKVVSTISGPKIDGPWDMATVVHGSQTTLFVTNTLIGVKSPGQTQVNQGDVVRITLNSPADHLPTVAGETVIASGFPEIASSSAFVIGPTGLGAGANNTVYVSDILHNRIAAIPNAMTRMTSAGIGKTVTEKGDLHHPLAMAMAPNGDILVSNALNGSIVEVTPSGKQIAEVDADDDPAQSPPGSGDLFGIAVAPQGHGVYFVKDDTNTLALLD